MLSPVAMVAATVFPALAGDVGTAWAVIVWVPSYGSARGRPRRGLALLASTRGRRPRSSSSRSRLLGSALALLLLAALTGGGEGPRLPPHQPPYDVSCSAWTERGRTFVDTRAEDRERAFLCLVRDAGGPMFPPDKSDQALLTYGRELCAQPMWRRIEDWLRSEDRTINLRGLDSALVFLCPDVIGGPDLLPPDEQMAKENADYYEASNATCSDPWPKIRARRQGTAAYFTSEGGGYHLADGKDPDNEYGVELDYDRLLTVEKTSVGIRTIGETNICVTVKAFAKAPPLRLKGWEEVAEAGVTSRSGRLMVPTMPPGADEGAGRPLPNLAIKGPGRYRVRVYARADEDTTTILPTERHLIVVYPGRSSKEVVYRSHG